MGDYVEQYQFRYIDSEGKEILYTCKPDSTSWHELIRDFEMFLQGCSFVFKEGTIFDRVDGGYDW